MERMRQKKYIDEERQEQEWFKPKTNVKNYDSEFTPNGQNNLMRYTPHDQDMVTFEQSKEFNQGDYDMYKVTEDERLQEMDDDFLKLKEKKQRLEKATSELLNPQLTRSSSDSIENPGIQRKKLFGRNSEFCGTSVTTSHETYKGPRRRTRKESNPSGMKKTPSQPSLLCLSGSKSSKKNYRSPQNKPGENLHSVWADYIRERKVSSEQVSSNASAADHH